MRFAKMLSIVIAVAVIAGATTVHAAVPNAIRYGKTAWTLGTYDGGPNANRYGASRTYSYAPMNVAAAPATGERRTFSAEPSAPQPAAPAAAAPAASSCCLCGK